MSKHIHSEFAQHRPNVSYSDFSDPLAPTGLRSTRGITRHPGQYPGLNLGDFKTQRLAIAIHTYQPGGYHPLHAHPDLEQAYYVISGQATVKIGDESAVIGPGGSAFFPPGVEHDFRNAGEETLVIAVISSMV